MISVDIAGSPYHLLGQLRNTRLDSETMAKIERSFAVDSAMNIVAPVLGTSPVIYYAENTAATIVDAKSGIVANCVAFGFLMMGLTGILLSYFERPLTQIVPNISVAPALFMVGLIMIANSLSQAKKLNFRANEHRDREKYEKYLPIAITIILAPFGLDYAIAGGLAACYIISWVTPQDNRKGDLIIDPNLWGFALLAFLAVVIRIIM